MIKYWLLIMAAIFTAAAITSCSKSNPIAPSVIPEQGKMVFALDAASENIASGQVTITKGALTHVLPVTMVEHAGSVTFNAVQVGHWNIQVQLFDAGGVEIYSGDGTAVVSKDQTTTVTVRVNHNTGNLQIDVELPYILEEDFSSATLDSAWEIVTIPGYGSYSLTENPGNLRYHLEGSRGHSDGWYTNYAYNSQGWSPTTTLIRPFQGDHWVLRTKAYFNLHCNDGGASMGAQTACLWIAFGNGNDNRLKIDRTVDYAYASNTIEYSYTNTGGTPETFYTNANCAPEDTNKDGWYQYTYYFQIERSGQNVAVSISYNGVSYNQINTFVLPASVEGTQRIILDSVIWASVGSFVDWDYFLVE